MSKTVTLTPEILVPRLGEYLVEKGWLAEEGLQKAVRFQIEQKAIGEDVLLGEVLIDMGLISRKILDQAITELILQLRSALEDANLRLEQRVKERTARLEIALEKLTNADRLKNQLVANISHELRTPLTHVKGYVELLMEEELGPLNSIQKHGIEVMHIATSRLEKLIDDLIQFSIQESKDVKLIRQHFDLTELCKEILSGCQKKIVSASLKASIEAPNEIIWVNADREKISWAVQQLIDNSIKFTKPDGIVKIVLNRNRSDVRLAVKDTGIGIPGEKMEDIFEPFHQLDGSSTRRYGGTGLGLALVRKIIESHGSTIGLTSSLGNGSCFEFSLPLSEPTV